jgi:hypothetical protein
MRVDQLVDADLAVKNQLLTHVAKERAELTSRASSPLVSSVV